MSKLVFRSLSAAAAALIPFMFSSAFALGPAAPRPLPPPALAASFGPAAPRPLPPPALAASFGPAAPRPLPPPAIV